ncbi:MAG: PhnD/SsuA/transferrin family substrate-binding protein [Azospirillaceae bacterium]|nr:PhnD/SsuA/transferrin family substrate-binding protein [Azospirillaceae bacterium]
MHDRLEDAGIDGSPAALTRTGSDLDTLWRDPNLLFAQTCGYPLSTALRGVVRVVATPCYRFPGCDGPTHRSLLIVPGTSPHRELAALRGRRLAINGWDSNSGMNLLRAMVARLAAGKRFFSAVTVTGSHVESIAAVGRGDADLAAIDNVTWGHMVRWRPGLTAAVRVIGETPATPALPFITARRTPIPTLRRLRDALAAVMADPTLAPIRDTLGLWGIVVPDPGAYRRVLALERAAIAAGYPTLA